jgi:flagellar FlgN protein
MDSKVTASTASLEQVLRQLLVLHTELLDLLRRKQDKLRTNDAKAMIDFCALEHEKVQGITDLEKHRLKLVAELTLAVDPGAAEPMRLGELAGRLDEPVRGRLLVQRQQLLEKMKQVQSETSVVRRATETLSKHMQGIIQTIGAISTGVSTYGSGGAFPQRSTAVSTFSATA